jgi:hypothetical protein
MLDLRDDYDHPDNIANQPDYNPGLPEWDQVPDLQIMEIMPEPEDSAIPPGMEQDIIGTILGIPELFRLPDNKQPNPGNPAN